MQWIDAETAMARMGTQRQTLYANVSRGRIRARPDPKDSRKSLYALDDVKRLAARKRGRPASDILAAGTIRWGAPVLTSSISTIVEGRLFYRGKDAIELARLSELEDALAFLWQMPESDLSAESGVRTGIAGALQMLARRAVDDPPTLGRSPAVLREAAARVFADLATCLAGSGDGDVANRLAYSWKRPDAASSIRAALVLLADHELNASTFAARVTASTGAPLASCVLAGLCALSGPLHGGVATAIAALVSDAERSGARPATRQWLARGQSLPAFGHPLYPKGDPRAVALLDTFEMNAPMGDLREAAEELSGEPANIDFALCALKMRFDLPADAPMEIFALARSVGWLAHALEQIESGELIRPRARYAGPDVEL